MSNVIQLRPRLPVERLSLVGDHLRDAFAPTTRNTSVEIALAAASKALDKPTDANVDVLLTLLDRIA